MPCKLLLKQHILKTINLVSSSRPIYDSDETRCLWENHALFLLWGQGPSANTRWYHHRRTSPAEAHCVYLQPDPIFSHSLENDDDDDRKPLRRKILNGRQRVLQRSCSFVHSISGIGIGGEEEEERDMTSSLIYVNYRKRRKERLKPQAAL